jgi:hypothetical protein
VRSSYGTDSEVEESDADGESSQGMMPRSVRCGFDVMPHQAGANDLGPQSINASTLVPGTVVEASDACQKLKGQTFCLSGLPQVVPTLFLVPNLAALHYVTGAQSGLMNYMTLRGTIRLSGEGKGVKKS